MLLLSTPTEVGSPDYFKDAIISIEQHLDVSFDANEINLDDGTENIEY